MNIVVIGLGSMGKRRVRNLMALGLNNIAGYDKRDDRLLETSAKYGIKIFDNLESAILQHHPDAFVISTPPDKHLDYASFGCDNNISCFIEASVLDAERIRSLAKRASAANLIMAPSCTMRYFPGIKKTQELLLNGVIGKVLNINYHTGQYLPDWHPWEDIRDYYVSKPETGAAREIVPFELTWLSNLFGIPVPLACVKDKVTELPTNIDDIYHCILRFPQSVLCNMTIEVISRPSATRELRILGTEGTLVFSQDAGLVKYRNVQSQDWVAYDLAKGTIESQYINPEEPYIAEMRDFLDAVQANDANLFPNTLYADACILDVLYGLESMSEPR